PETLDYADRAPVVIERVGVIDGTSAEVWAVLADHPRWPNWFPAVKAAEATSDPPRGVGSTRRVTIPAGITVDERFIAWDEPAPDHGRDDPPGVWAFTGTGGPPVWERLVERV